VLYKSPWKGLTKLEGITPDESVVHSIRCTYENSWGDLVLTNKSIVFLKIKGMLGHGRERLHQLDYDDIDLSRTKKKKSGIFRHGIVLGNHSKSIENQAHYYSCEEYKAVLFLALFERQKLLLKTPEESSSTIQSLSKFKRDGDLLKVAKNPKMKPYVSTFFLEKTEAAILNLLRHRSEVDLYEVATNKEVHSLIARLHWYDPRQIPKDQVYYTVNDIVAHLILRRDLDGIITDVGSYISNKALARIKVPFEELADYETIFTLLKEKGLLIWTLECPSCFRRIKYPKKGKEITCQFCESPIRAIDVFKKFKDLL
jgi:hypothetical protein